MKIFLYSKRFRIFHIQQSVKTLPVPSPGAFFHQQSINLNLRTFYPSVGVLISGNVLPTLQIICGKNKTRTCDLKAMTLAS